MKRKTFLELPIEKRRSLLEVQALEFAKDELLEGIALKLYEFDGGTQEYLDTSPKDRKEYLYRAKLMADYLARRQCPLCGQTSFGGQPHKGCGDYEQYLVDQMEG